MVFFQEEMMDTKFFKQNKGELAYDDRGSGPLVIGVSGFGDLRAEYRFLAPQLVEAGYRVVTMDLRGHGESSVDWPDYSLAAVGSDLLALIRYLDAGPAILIGNSMFAGAAVWAAAEAPDLVSGLVLIGPVVRDFMPIWQVKLMYSPLFIGPWGPAVWTRYYQTLFPSRKPGDFPAYLSSLSANIRQPGRMAAVRAMMTSSKRDAEQRLDQVSAPVLVLMGTRDPDFKDPAAEANWVADRLSAQVRLVDGAGHYPHAEMPEVSGPAVISFLESLKEKEAQAYVA
jgi:pimeloyl-ACP methyl ester carboxylesterase